MKKIFILILTTVSALILAGCDDMLDRVPKDKLSPETYFKTAKECELFTNEFYLIFPGASSIFYEEADVIVPSVLSDAVQNTRTVPATDGNWDWEDLRNINFFLEHADQCEDAKARARYVGLAKFFRTYFYWLKIRRFGDVPWVDRAMDADDEELYKPRDDRKLVVAHMLEDINYAIDNLPSEKSVFKVTKWTALALKARFCLFEGTYRKYHAGDVTLQNLPADAKDYKFYLEQAAAAADEFITSSGYSIYASESTAKSYIGLFTKYRVSEGTNKEIILARNYSIEFGVTHSANAAYVSSTLGRVGLTRKIVASYLMKDGSRFTDKAGWETMQFVEETKNRDPRLAQSIRTPGYCRLGTDIQTAPNINNSVTGYAPIKYFMGPEDDTYQQSYCDLVLFRAAEVYLAYAEAKAELGTITQTDIDRSIKPLRDRVGMPNLDLAEANANPDPYLLNQLTGYPKVAEKNSSNVGVILEIRRERTIELIQEGYRYYDVIRWAEGHTFESQLLGMYFPGDGNYDLNADGIADVTLYSGASAPAGSASLALKIGSDVTLSDGNSGCLEFHKTTRQGWTWNDGKDYLYPIPVEDRSLTQGALTQNPGWNDGLSF